MNRPGNRPGAPGAPAQTTFQYRAPTKSGIAKRAKQQGGMFDAPLMDTFPTFNPKEGDHKIRIMPALGFESEHFGFEVFLHYNVGGTDKGGGSTYICAFKMGQGPCPICDEQKALERQGDAEAARDLRATKRVLYWLVDRNDENAGLKLWLAPWTFDRDLANMCIDRETQELLLIDHWVEGYDVFFSRTGAQLLTKYTGIQLARHPSPLSLDDAKLQDWLQYVNDNPLPNVLNYYSYDHIKQAFIGAPPAEAPTAQEEAAEEVPAQLPTRNAPTRQPTRAPVAAPVEPEPEANAAPEEYVDEVPAEAVDEGAVEQPAGEEPPVEELAPEDLPLDEPSPPATTKAPWTHASAGATKPAPSAPMRAPAPTAARPAVGRPVAPAPASRPTTPTTARPAAAPARPAAPAARPVAPSPTTRLSPPTTAARPTTTARPATTAAPVAKPSVRDRINAATAAARPQ